MQITMTASRFGPSGALYAAGTSYDVANELALYFIGLGVAAATASARESTQGTAPTALSPVEVSAARALVSRDGNPAYDASGRVASYQTPGGRVAALTYSAGKISRAGSTPPWLYLSANGPVNFMHQSNIRGVGFGVNGSIHCISTQDKKYYRYTTAAGWGAPLSSAIDASGGIFTLMFMDSRGYLYAAWQTPSRTLYRSTDNGATWGVVMNTTQMPVTNDYVGFMTEADNGYLFATIYNSVDVAGVATNAFYRSIDGGATWVNITANLAVQYLKHIHCLKWDKHRRCLWVSGGDGVPATIQCSTDYGASFSSLALSNQAVAITMDADYLYYCADLAGDHGIYRCAGATAAAVLASRPVRVFKLSEVAGTDGTEFAWWADVDAAGNVVFPYSKGAKAVVAASSDQGASWTDVLDSQVAGTTNFGFELISPSEYVTGRDGYYIGASNTVRYALRWRVYPSKMRWLVDSAAGDDDFGDGLTTPRRRIPEAGVKPQAVVTLQSPYTLNASVSLPGLVLDTNGYTLGVAVSGTPAVSETFEGASSLTTTTAASGTVDQASTANPYAGTRAARCVTAASGGSAALVVKASAFSALASGDTAWVSARFSLATATLTVQPIIMQVQNGVSLYIDTTASGGGLMVQTSVDSRFYRQALDDYTAFPMGAYVQVKVRVYLHATKGEVEVWQAGRRVLFVKGVNTIHTGPTSPRWGLLAAQVLTMDVDNVLASANFDPDQPPAYSLNGQGQLLLRELIRSDQ